MLKLKKHDFHLFKPETQLLRPLYLELPRYLIKPVKNGTAGVFCLLKDVSFCLFCQNIVQSFSYYTIIVKFWTLFMNLTRNSKMGMSRWYQPLHRLLSPCSYAEMCSRRRCAAIRPCILSGRGNIEEWGGERKQIGRRLTRKGQEALEGGSLSLKEAALEPVWHKQPTPPLNMQAPTRSPTPSDSQALEL